MSLRNIIKQTQLLLDQALNESRKAMAGQKESALRPLQVTQLEQRVLMSASPLAAIADAPEAAASELRPSDSANLSDLQLLDIMADEVLPHANLTTGDIEAGQVSDEAIEQTLELVFIDSRISDVDQMVADLHSEDAADFTRTLEVVVLDADRDGIAQMTAALLQHNGIDGIHVVSHGSRGHVQLGATDLSLETLDTYRSAMSAWQHSLSEQADVLFYGCDLAAGEDGRELMRQIADECDCDVSASEDLTGNSELDGDWDLEYSVGEVTTQVAFSSEFQTEWWGTLGEVEVTTTADVVDLDADLSSLDALKANSGNDGLISLREAILAANADTGSLDVIQFNLAGPGVHVITLTNALPGISDSVIIDGTTQTDFTDVPLIAIDADAVVTQDTLWLAAGSDGSTIRGLQFRNGGPDNLQIDSHNNVIVGNYFGTDGTNNLSSIGNGITINGVGNRIGGALPGDRNVIVADSNYGIWVDSSAEDTTIVGNYIGLSADGTSSIANSGAAGIRSESLASGLKVGGMTAAERNVIVGFSTGVYVRSADTTVTGNYIGTDATGLTAEGQYSYGITATSNATNLKIGGTSEGERNVIAGSGDIGIHLNGTTDAVVQGNWIGVSAAGDEMGLGLDGVRITGNATGTLIGGSTAAKGNVIAHNNGYGVSIEDGSGTVVRSNSIYENQKLDLNIDGGSQNGDGVSSNDADTPIASGTSNPQNFPVLSEAVLVPGQVTINGSLTSAANTSYRIDFYKSDSVHTSGHGGGQTHLGSQDVGSNASGVAGFSATLAADINNGDFVTATATLLGPGSVDVETSEFSQARVAAPVTLVVDTLDDVFDGDATDVTSLRNSRGADGKISLREALAAANNNPVGITIQLGEGRHELTRTGEDADFGDFDITSNVTIVGAGSSLTTIDGNDHARIFEVISSSATFQGLRLLDGRQESTFGGGLHVPSGAEAILDDVILDSNGRNSLGGGGIYNAGTLTVTDSWFKDNTAGATQGGGIYNEGMATLTRVLMTANTADTGLGGAIHNANGGDLTLINVTVSGNSANDGTGSGVSSAGTTTIINSTIANNGNDGLRVNAGTTTVKNSIFANNGGNDVFGTVIATGVNIIGDTTNSAGFRAEDQQNVNPLLDALADNGGPFQSHALLPGSTAIDAGRNSEAPADDQHGVARDAATDIGAVEFTGASAVNLSSGIELNSDGANDAYLTPTNAGNMLGGLTSLTVEATINVSRSDAYILSYATSTSDDALLLHKRNDGKLSVFLDGVSRTSAAVDYNDLLADGQKHSLAFSWDSTNGTWAIYVDGKVVDSGSGLRTGTALSGSSGDGVLVLGQEQDSVGGGFDSSEIFRGTFHDVRIWNDVRTEAEISRNYQNKFDRSHLPAGLLANWQMEALTGSNVVMDVVSGNDLRIGHATGTGFETSTPTPDLHISEYASSGASAGFVSASSSVSPRDLVDDGLFSDAADPTTSTNYSAGQSIGGWTVAGSGDVNLHNANGVFQAETPLGGNSIHLAAGSDSSIEQIIKTVPGRRYQVVFAGSGFWDTAGVKQLQVSANGESKTFAYEVAPNNWNFANSIVWEPGAMNFTATDTSTMLTFRDASGYTGDGILIADVQVLEVPGAVNRLLENDATLSYDAATNKFYRHVDSLTEFDAALSSAIGSTLNGVSGGLVRIDSHYENELIRQFSVDSGRSLWLGASDDNNDGQWNWLDGRTESQDRFWSFGNAGSATDGHYAPNFDQTEATGEDFASIDTDGTWSDDLNTASHEYVIEWNASDVVTGFVFSLTDASSNFEINSGTGEITVAANNTLDHDVAASHHVRVTATSVDGQTYSETMTIAVDNGIESSQTVPASQTIDEDSILTFTSGTATEVSVSDGIGSNDSQLRVSLSVNDGVLHLSQLTGLTFVEGANGSRSLIVDGTESAINAALDGMTFTPAANFHGAVTLNMTTDVKANLSGDYTFDGNVNDEAAGTENDGVLFNGASMINDAQRGNVLSLQGSDQYVEIEGLFGEPADVTVAAWVNVESGSVSDEIISLGDSVVLRSLDDDARGLQFIIRGNPVAQTIDTGINISGAGWTHVAATVNDQSGEVAVYINGELILTDIADESIHYNTDTNTRIGQHGVIHTQSMKGLIDDVRVYTRTLTAADIAALAVDVASASDSVAITVAAVNDAPTFRVGTGNATSDTGAGEESAGDSYLMPDGKLLVAATFYDGIDSNFQLMRYNENGTLDSSFGNSGIVVTAFAQDSYGRSVEVQPDGKILVAGGTSDGSSGGMAVVRYNTDGTLDTSFRGDGTLEFSLTSAFDEVQSIAIQQDGKIVLVGEAYDVDADVGVVRLNSDGSFDTTFDGDGKLLLQVGLADDFVKDVAVQRDGKIVVGGVFENASGFDDEFLARLNSDGSLDTSFDTDGIATTAYATDAFQTYGMLTIDDANRIISTGSMSTGAGDFSVVARYDRDGSLDASFGNNGTVQLDLVSGAEGFSSVSVLADGKLILTGQAQQPTTELDLIAVRLNDSGSLDTTFDGDGIATVELDSYKQGISGHVAANGDIVIVGQLHKPSNTQVNIARLNSDGSTDLTFNPINTIDGSPTFVEGGEWVVLDGQAQIYDEELSAADDFGGATLTLARAGGGNVDDFFNRIVTSNLSFNAGKFFLSGVQKGSYASANGQTVMTFDSGVTNAEVNEIMQVRTFRNNDDTPPASVDIVWTFNDGGNTVQSQGGAALQASETTTVNITAANDEQVLATNTGATVTEGSTGNTITTAMLETTDADHADSELVYTVTSASANGSLLLSGTALEVTHTFTQADIGSGKITYDHSGGEAAIDSFGFTVDDGAGTTTSATFNFTITPVNDAPTFLGQGPATFGSGNVITATADSANSVITADVDSDGDLDVLSASYIDDTIAWYENDGNQGFTEHVITNSADFAYDVSTADLDGDGDLDVLTASRYDDTVAWYENDGNQNFTQRVITNTAVGAGSVTAVDMDGDGDLDVVAASGSEDTIAWYENDGSQVFTQRIITTTADAVTSIVTVDVDGDGDLDVLSASFSNDGLAWYENDGSQSFTRQAITSTLGNTTNISFADLDGDGDLDLLSTSQTQDTVAWFENNGSQIFTERVITNSADGAYDVTAVDIDGDGDLDVVSALLQGDAITWYENDGHETFTSRVITNNADGAVDVTAVDLDGDGDLDVLSASRYDDTIAWYENQQESNVLAGTVVFTEDGPAIALDSNANISDAELDALNGGNGNYSGSSVTLVRDGGSNSEDVLSFSDGNGITLSGGSLIKNGQVIASFDNATTSGQLVITFTDANLEIPTSADVDNILSQLTYRNSSDAPPASVQIDWTFDDGNSGSQGSGGSISVTGSTTVEITATINNAPTFQIIDGEAIVDFSGTDDFLRDMVVQPDGKILAVGSTSNGVSDDVSLVRFNSDGSLDPTFGTNGSVITDLGGGEAAMSVALQSDGKIVIAGLAYNGSDYDYAVVRYNSNGSLDTTFSNDGKVLTDIGGGHDYGNDVAIQADGKIVVTGGSDSSFVTARYNTDGSLDTTFNTNGIVITALGTVGGGAESVLVQADGKIVVAGYATDDGTKVSVVRYDSSGNLDNSFGTNGIVVTDFSGSTEQLFDVIQQADGKLLVAGSVYSGATRDFTIIRYHTDGTLDASFGGDGIITTDIDSGIDVAHSVALQTDGKIVVAGRSNDGTNIAFAIVRYNVDGTLDTSFDSDGIVTTAAANGYKVGMAVKILPDGKILFGGYTNAAGTQDYAVLRYNADGSQDFGFGIEKSLDGNPTFVEGGAAVVLDDDVEVFDKQLSAVDNFDGASLTLARTGGAHADDTFLSKATGTLGAIAEGTNNLVVNGTTIGSVTTNSGGTLVLSFNGSATNALVNEAMQQIAYSNSNDTPPPSVKIDWTFDDGGNSVQSQGGSALQATGSTTVDITSTNDEQILATNAGATVAEGSTGTTITAAMLETTDIDNTDSELVYTVTSIPANGTLKRLGVGVALNDTFTQADIDAGNITYDHDGSEATTDSFDFSVDDGAGTATPATFNLTITPVNDAPAITNLAGDSLSYDEGDGAVVVDQGTAAIVADADLLDFNGGNLTVTSSTTGDNTEDQLSIRNQGTGSGQIGFDGTNVTYQNVLIGTASGGANGSDLVITFSTNANVAAVSALARNVTYENSDTENPTEDSRVISFTVNDGDGGTSASNDVTISVSRVNDAPVNNLQATQSVVEDGTLVFSLGNGNVISVNDIDSGTSDIRVTLTVTNGDFNLAGTTGLTSFSGDGSTSVTIEGTNSAIFAALNGSSFVPTVNYNGSATLTMVTTDLGNTGSGGAQTDTDVMNITVTPVNDAPILDNTSAPRLPTITEDEIDNAGMTVADLLATGGTGSPITDGDGDPEGIAITTSNNDRGNWEYSTNGGSNWSSVGTASESSSLLLRSTDLVRFNPNTVNAPVTDPTFVFRAWDQTSGTAGTKVDVSTNGGATAFSSTSETASISVTDVNDEEIVAINTGTAVAEGSISNAITAAMLQATDVDTTAAQLVYTVDSLPANGTLYRNGLAVNVNSTFTQSDIDAGLVTYNHNGSQTTSDSFTFTVDDGIGVTTSSTFDWAISNINDAPVISSDGGGDTASVHVTENSTAVTTVIGTDADGDTLSYSITGGADAARFAIDSSTGELTFVTAPDFESPVDAGTNNVYEVAVRSSDGNGGTDFQTITITVNDVNEFHATAIVDTDATANNIDENETIGTAVGITAFSEDLDATNSSISYSLHNNPGGLFAIDSTTGVVTTAAAVDFEAVGGSLVIAVRSTSTDGSTATRSYTITVNDLNDNTPVVVAGQKFSVSEFSATGTSPGLVAATDADAVGTLSWIVTSGNENGVFAIDSATGRITIADTTALNFEVTPAYSLTITVSDGQHTSVAEAVQILISDENEAPVLSAASFSVNENSSNGTVVGTATASDDDIGDSIVYSLSDDADGRFVIDAGTGLITVASSSLLDFEASSSHAITATVTDSQGLSHTQAFSIAVMDVNEAPVAVGDQFMANQLETLSISVAELLQNDFDGDGDSLSIVLISGTTNGELTQQPDGSFTYIPAGLLTETDSFSYLVSDGSLTSHAVEVDLKIQITIAVGPTNPEVVEPGTETETPDPAPTTREETTQPSAESTKESSGSNPDSVQPAYVESPDQNVEQKTGADELAGGLALPDSARQPFEYEYLQVDVSTNLDEVVKFDIRDHKNRTARRADDAFRNSEDRLSSSYLFSPTTSPNPFLIGEAFDLNHQQYADDRTAQSEALTLEKVVIGSTAVVSTSVSVGYMVWMLRGGSLLTSVLTSLPAWQGFDPLPILEEFNNNEGEQDDESLASLVS